MAIVKLTNSQIKDVVNESYRQFIGTDDVNVNLDLSKFTDTGTTDVNALRSNFTGKLLGVLAKNWYTDTSARSTFKDVFYEDENRFGSIIQAISVSVPEVKENSAWREFESGVSQVGVYTVYLPVVDTQYYTKSESWALPITVTGQQWDTAFKSEEELYSFVDYLFLVLDNAIVKHMEDMNASNRNNFIAEKINAQEVSAGKYNAVNLVKEYCDDRGIATSFSVGEFLQNKDCLLFAIEKIKMYMGFMQKQTSLFNTAGKVRHTPTDRLVVQILSYFEERLFSNALSDTFHADMISLPYHESVPAWQSVANLDFNGLSTINIKSASGKTIKKSGIVALICDKWAILHTVKRHRIASQYFSIEDLTHYEYQYRDQYMNNLTMNGLVLYLDNVVVA